MQATTELLDLKPAAIEHIDRLLFDQTRGQREFQAVRDLLELDAKPCEAILIVEFFEDAAERLAQLEKRRLGLRKLHFANPGRSQPGVGDAQGGTVVVDRLQRRRQTRACFVEDTAVRPRDLPAYFAGLQKLMARLGLPASYYGHAAAGLLHVRPVLDLHSAEDLKKYRQIADEVAALVSQFKGTLAGEHGVGIARTEYLKDQVGDELYQLMREIKQCLRPGQSVQSGQNHFRRPLQN